MPTSNYSVVRLGLVFCASFLSLCSRGTAAQTSPASPVPPAVREVTDGFGRTVRVPLNPSRIVSLAPSLTETLYALGVEDRLVGDTNYCDYPPEAQKKPKVGGVINPNLEEIAALHPDLVLLSKEGNLLDTVRSLDALGISTYATDAHTIDEIVSSTQKLADVLNVPAAGEALAEELQQRLAAVELRLHAVPPKEVLFIVWPEPLISVGKDTFIADALRRAGAASIIDSDQDWPQVNLEEVARLQPQYLVFAPSHSDSATRDFEALASRPGWRILDAVRNRRFAIVSDAIVRPAPRIVSVIEDLARQLHPDVFQEAPGGEKAPPATNSPGSVPFQVQPAVLHFAVWRCSAELSCVH